MPKHRGEPTSFVYIPFLATPKPIQFFAVPSHSCIALDCECAPNGMGHLMEKNNVSLEKIDKNDNFLLNKLAEARRNVFFLRDRLKAMGALTPSAIASLDQADEAYRASIEMARNIKFLQADTVTKLEALMSKSCGE